MNVSRLAFGRRFAACALSLAAVALSLDSMPVRAVEALNVYSIWPENRARPMLEEFEKASGIKIDFVGFSSGEALAE